MPWLVSALIAIFSSSTGLKKLGQPDPESNFAADSNSAMPQQTQRYTPSSWQFQYSPVKAGSVPH